MYKWSQTDDDLIFAYPMLILGRVSSSMLPSAGYANILIRVSGGSGEVDSLFSLTRII